MAMDFEKDRPDFLKRRSIQQIQTVSSNLVAVKFADVFQVRLRLGVRLYI